MRSLTLAVLSIALASVSGVARADKLVLPLACDYGGQGEVTLNAKGDLSGQVKFPPGIEINDVLYCAMACDDVLVVDYQLCGRLPPGKRAAKLKVKGFAPGANCLRPTFDIGAFSAAAFCTPRYDQIKP